MGTTSATTVAAVGENIYSGICPLNGSETLDTHGFLWPMGSQYQWMEMNLLRGWILIDDLEPEDAPAGSILIYEQSSDGFTNCESLRQRCLEIITPEHKIGQRKFSSGLDRITEDGVIVDRFMGVYVHPAYLSEKQRALYKYEGLSALRQSFKKHEDAEDNRELSEAFTRSSKYEADAKNALLNPVQTDLLM